MDAKHVTANMCHCTIYKNDLSRNIKHITRLLESTCINILWGIKLHYSRLKSWFWRPAVSVLCQNASYCE